MLGINHAPSSFPFIFSFLLNSMMQNLSVPKMAFSIRRMTPCSEVDNGCLEHERLLLWVEKLSLALQ